MSLPHRLKNLVWLKTPRLKVYEEETSYQLIGTRGRVRLLHFKAQHPLEKAPLLIIPSLINTYKILDLDDESSLIQDLVKRGHQVYLLDWSHPRPIDRHAIIEDHVMRWIHWGVQSTLRHSQYSKLHLLGHCLGGTLAAIYHSLHQDSIKSLIMLTAPIDFKAPGLLREWTQHSRVDLDLMKDVFGNISEQFLRESFKWIQPLGEFKKRKTLLKNLNYRDFVEMYDSIEGWLSQGIHFPGQAYLELIQDFYQANKLYRDELHYNELDVRLENITSPTLCLWARGDIIVPPESANGITKKVSSLVNESIALEGGHIGCLISKRHRHTLRQGLHQWLTKEIFNETTADSQSKNTRLRHRHHREELRSAH